MTTTYTCDVCGCDITGKRSGVLFLPNDYVEVDGKAFDVTIEVGGRNGINDVCLACGKKVIVAALREMELPL